jgi:hypothetical protein
MDTAFLPLGHGFVSYLEPMGAPGWQMGFAKKPLNIRQPLSFEHADSAGDEIYWVVRYKIARKVAKEIKGLSDMPAWARHFGLEARRLKSGPSDAVKSETDPWFTNPEYGSAWFEVSGDGDGIGYHFAVLVYIGNHLRWIAGPRLQTVHLVAEIEGRPNIMQKWNRRS